ncbi:MAG: outer membrane beta-barrel protein [Fimbriiglobus sp.]
MLTDLFLGAALMLGQTPMPASVPTSIPKVMPAPVTPTAPDALPSSLKRMPAMQAGDSPLKMPAPPTGAAPATTAPATPAPAATPLTLKDGEKLIPNGDGTYRIESGAAAAPSDAPAAEEPKADEGPSTLFMKAIDGTSLGTLLAGAKTTISGFVDLRYTATNGVNLNRLPPGMGFSFNPDLPQFNWITVDRAVDKESKEASFGYHMDLILYGSAYQFTQSRGLLNKQLTDRDGLPNRYGIDPVQAYGELYLPNVAKGMDIKVGRMFARFGVESLNPTLTPLPSYSYAFTYNPYTYTGVATDTKITDKLTLSNDFYLGNDIWFDSASRFTWLGALQYDFTDKTNVRVATILGHNAFDAAENVNHTALLDVVLTHKFTDKLTYNFEFLYGWQNDVPGLGHANWVHFVNYLTYSWNDKHSTTARFELFDDTDGNRTGTNGLYQSYTLGHTWKPKSWLNIRPEVRYDHNSNRPFDGKSDFFGFTINAQLLW